MATKVILPKQGLQMIEGTITNWLVAEGGQVEAEQPLFEMETDKLNIEIVAPASGTLLKIIKDVGEVVPITETIAVIGEPGEDISEFLKEEKAGNMQTASERVTGTIETGKATQDDLEETAGKRQLGERVFITPRAKMTAAEKGIDYHNIIGTGPDGIIIERDVLKFVANTKAIKATPLAAKVAQQNSIEMSEINGSGPRGKIMQSDVVAAVALRRSKTQTEGRRGSIMPFSGMRKVISDRMMESLHNMAQTNHRMKVDMTELIRFREKLKQNNMKISFTDILVKVVSKALMDFPIVNSSLTDEGILLKDYVHMGLAVSVENGLIVPVIKDADLMTLEEISIVSAELIVKAKKGGLKPDEYTGGTFTITNLGMFDIDEFTAVINPPESAILAIGKIDRVPVVEGDTIVIKPILMLSLTYDHRIIDGAPAAKFLQRVKQLMQNPYLLI